MRYLFVATLLFAGCQSNPYQHPYAGQINQVTGLVWQEGWVRAWWNDSFDAAKAKGCHLEDSCGVFPPYHTGVEYCGEPITICPGQTWRSEHDRLSAERARRK